MNIAFCSSECVPFAKTGGLADVSAALPKALSKLGHQVSVFLPYYQTVRSNQFDPKIVDDEVTVSICKQEYTGTILSMVYDSVIYYFVDQPHFFDRPGLYQTEEGGDYPDNLFRFTFFCLAILSFIKKKQTHIDVIHCNDWQTALIPTFIRTRYDHGPFFINCTSVYTIHNLRYQGIFPVSQWDTLGLDWKYFNYQQLEFYDHINLMKAGIVFSDRITTVSKRYAEEIQTPGFGEQLEGVLLERREDLFGILNGVDYDVWNPETDPYLYGINYSMESLEGKQQIKKKLCQEVGLPFKPGRPLLGIISRLDNQKGLDLIASTLDRILQEDVQFILLGTGNKGYHEFFQHMQRSYPSQVSAQLGFNNEMAHKIEAAADIYLMPSQYEPCGLNQLYSLRYGTLPIVRSTGGLADTIKDGINGFSFLDYDAHLFLKTVLRALDVYKDTKRWSEMIHIAMSQNHSWEQSARRYEQVYRMGLI